MLQHGFVPFLHARLCFLDKTAIVVVIQHGQQFTQGASAVAYESHVYREAQADTLWVEIDLNSTNFLAQGIELKIRKGSTDHQQCVALLERLLRGLGAEQTDAARGVWIVIRHRGFSQKRLDDWRTQSFGNLDQFVGGVQRALSGEYCNLAAFVQNVR